MHFFFKCNDCTMNHKRTFSNIVSLYATVVVLIVYSLPYTKSQIQPCPFLPEDPGTAFNIVITADDVADENNQIWTGVFETNEEIRNIFFGSNNLTQIPDPKIERKGNENNISIYPIQDNFMDKIDIEGKDIVGSSGPLEGLQMELSTGTSRCLIRVNIRDTNNRKPILSTRTNPLSFTISTTWDKSIPLNWKLETKIQITDWDYTATAQTIESTELGGIELKGDVTVSRETIENAYVYDVQLFVKGDLLPGDYPLQITPFDEFNRGDPVDVNLKIDENDVHEPVFKSEEYFVTLSNMPDEKILLELSVQAYDPDDVVTGRESEFVYEVQPLPGIVEFLKFEDPKDTKLIFTRKVPEFAGKSQVITIKATQSITNKVAEAKITINFPTPKVFDVLFIHHEYDHWPVLNQSLDIPHIIDLPGIPVAFEYVNFKLPDSIELKVSTIRFTKDMNPELLGDFKDNRIVIFDLKATGIDSGVAFGVATYVLTFPAYDDDSSTTTETSTTAETPTTEFECPPPTTDHCDTSPTTGNPTTETACPPCPTDTTTTITDTTTCPPPDYTTPTECVCSTTVEPPEGSTGTGTVEPPEGSTGIPTTTETCPPCSTTDDPISNPTTCLPPDYTTEVPCNCSTTIEPPDCSTTGNPNTCPPCSTTDNPITNPTACTPCSTDDPITNPTTCPPPDPCECDSSHSPTDSTSTEDSSSSHEPCQQTEECSNTGLIIAVITTSVLCIAAIGSTGIALLLRRKATIDQNPLKPFSRRESLISSSSNPPPLPNEATPPPQTTTEKPESQIYDYATFSDNTPTNNPPPTSFPETGFVNESFINTEPELTSPPIPPEPDADSQPAKKSNIKTPKEIEPDYQVAPVPAAEVASKDSQVGATASDPKQRVLFAPADEYISIESDGGGDAGGGDDSFGEESLGDTSESDDERL